MERELVWRCLDCGEEAPPTHQDFMILLKHAKGHHVRLVDATSGEVLAASYRSAIKKGIELEPGTPAGLGKGQMMLDEAGIILPVALPPLVFVLFDAAKAAGWVKEDTDLDEWLFENTLKRFELDYKAHFGLIPIEERKDGSENPVEQA